MRDFDFGVNSWDGLRQVIDEITRRHKGFVFRGQSDAEWRLEPSLCRLLKEMPGMDVPKALEWETKLTGIFVKLSENRGYRYPSKDPLFVWPFMRHYGAPTRILDWSLDPNVAAYFATCTGPKFDGCIYYMDRFKLSNIVNITDLERLSRLGNPNQPYPYPEINGKLPVFFHAIKSGFERLNAQKGVFSCTNNDNILVDHDEVYINFVKEFAKKLNNVDVFTN
jgi:hypothetical protein